MKRLLPFFLALPLVQVAQGQTQAPLPPPEQHLQSTGHQAATAAPYVFLGRFLTSEYYQDKSGRYYISKVYQVMQVLRGGSIIKPGTITRDEVSDWHQGKPLVRPKPGYEKVLQPQMVEEGTEWGIYFCVPSQVPANPNPYLTSNRVPLSFYKGQSGLEPFWWESSSSHGGEDKVGIAIEGLGHRFDTEEEMNKFLRQIPNLKPLVQRIAAYPKIPFMDNRPGWKAYRKAHLPQPIASQPEEQP